MQLDTPPLTPPTLRTELSDTLRLSVPIIISQLSNLLMGLTDDLFVGRLLGVVPLGAAGFSSQQSLLLSSIGIGALGIGSALISQANGRADMAAVNRLYRAGLRVALLLGVVFGGVVAVAALNIGWFRQDPAIVTLAQPFLLIMSVSNLPLFVFMAARQLADGLSLPRIVMGITIVALGVNALFNYLLIVGVGPFPEMGVAGSALATLLARAFMALAMLHYIHRSGTFDQYFKTDYNQQPVRAEVRHILRLGLPSGLMFFFKNALFGVIIVLVGWLGTNQLAAHQIAFRLVSITYMISMGVAAAASIRVGNALGRGDRLGIRQAGLSAFALSACAMGVMALLFMVFNKLLVGFYLTDAPGVVAMAATLVFMASFFQLADGFQVVGVGVLRGLSDVNAPTLITLFSYWLVALPTSYVLGFTLGYDVLGIWVGLLMGLTVSALLLTSRFFKLAGE
jgi:multidrug resistance protein, MATE family